MDKQYVILEVSGDFTWFANATSTEPPVRYYTYLEAEREAKSFKEARPTSRFIIVDIAPFEGAL